MTIVFKFRVVFPLCIITSSYVVEGYYPSNTLSILPFDHYTLFVAPGFSNVHDKLSRKTEISIARHYQLKRYVCKLPSDS